MSRVKKAGWRRVVSMLLIAAGIIGIGYYAVRTLREGSMAEEGREFYEMLAVQLFTELPAPADTPTDPQSQGEVDPQGQQAEPEPQPGVQGGAQVAPGPRVDFSALGDGEYEDMVAWIRSSGTKIDYPVMRGSDNEYYLSRLIDGTPNKFGSIFMDFRNAADLSGRHTLIYGHHIKGDDMFGSLEGYARQAYYNAHPTMELYTREGGSYTLELFSAYVVDADVETLPVRFKSAQDYEQYIEDVRARSFFTCDVEVSGGDRIVSLCTCTYSSKNARLIVVGKLVGS